MRAFVAALALLLASPAVADSPKVVTDVAPVQSLVAMVAGETPPVLISPGMSPHHFALRPSTTRALAQAEIVIWVGPALTPRLGDALEAVAQNAVHLTLFDAEADEEHGEDDHGHGHDHGGTDPHAWLDPVAAQNWLDRIADALAQADPDNGATYRENVRAAKAELGALITDVEAMVAPVKTAPFVVYHDAYDHFADRFGITSLEPIALGEGAAPGAARLRAVKDGIKQRGARCVFIEPQFDRRRAALVIEGSGADIGVLDPLGVDLEPGPGLYPALIRNLAMSLSECGSDTQ